MIKNLKKSISIIIPTHNESSNVVELHYRIKKTFDLLKTYRYQIIFVDDSTDDTPNKIIKIIDQDDCVNLVKLSRRFSQSIAISAGIDIVDADAVILMDADLQDPPESIPKLIKSWENGSHVVLVKRESEKRSFLYSKCANLFYKLLHKFSDLHIPKNVGEFRLLDRKVIDVMKRFKEKTRFLRGLTIWPGFNTSQIEIKREKRLSGITNYNYRRSLLVAVDGFISFSTIPLRVIFILSILLMIMSVIGIFYAIFIRLYTDTWVSGWTLQFVSNLLFFSAQLFILGIVGEYIGRIYIEVIDRPLYVIDYKVGKINQDP